MTPNLRIEIEKLQTRKRKAYGEVMEILKQICFDNPEMYKKEPYGRIKTIKSIEKHVNDKNLSTIEEVFDQVDDIAAMTIVCTYYDYVEETEMLIKDRFESSNVRVKKSITTGPDIKTGYWAHHLEITRKIHLKGDGEPIFEKCEVQIKTLAFDLWATYSHSEIYKPLDRRLLPSDIQSEMKFLSDQLKNIDERANVLRKKKINYVDDMIKTSVRFLYPTAKENDIISVLYLKELLASDRYRFKIQDDYACKMAYELAEKKVVLKKQLEKDLLGNKHLINIIKYAYNEIGITGDELDVIESIGFLLHLYSEVDLQKSKEKLTEFIKNKIIQKWIQRNND